MIYICGGIEVCLPLTLLIPKWPFLLAMLNFETSRCASRSLLAFHVLVTLRPNHHRPFLRQKCSKKSQLRQEKISRRDSFWPLYPFYLALCSLLLFSTAIVRFTLVWTTLVWTKNNDFFAAGSCSVNIDKLRLFVKQAGSRRREWGKVNGGNKKRHLSAKLRFSQKIMKKGDSLHGK